MEALANARVEVVISEAPANARVEGVVSEVPANAKVEGVASEVPANARAPGASAAEASAAGLVTNPMTDLPRKCSASTDQPRWSRVAAVLASALW